ncbi:CHS6 (YJL099W) and BCH2 (YKR027W) [Zygosaccharomyces parabailii]|nr:CHS6 (YJL099W) and BCH2 (YKR027W) [Zygosaccharomyces parabailii]
MSFLFKSKSKKKGPVAKDLQKHGASGFFPEDQVMGNENNATPSSAYTLTEFPRILERRFGESLGNRTRMLSELVKTDKLGLGPPDMVHATLYDKFHKEEIGEYFFITGVDISSESMPIAFLNMLKLNQLENQASKEGQISTYCCVNIFRHLDIRIRYESDKNYQVNAVDCRSGTTTVQLSDAIWEETFVSSCMRSLLTNVDPERKLPGLVEYPFAIAQGSTTNCKRTIKCLCKFLPRLVECGWDATKSVHPTVLHNNLTETLLTLLSVAPEMIDFTLQYLEKLGEKDISNKIYYDITRVAVMRVDGERDLEMIALIGKVLSSLLPSLELAPPRDSDSLHLVNCITDLLNVQAKFLLERGDSNLGLAVAKFSTELSSDTFDSWYNLAQCYIQLEQFDKALVAINCMPRLADTDKFKVALWNQSSLVDYYKRPLGGSASQCDLTSNELNNLSSTMKNTKEADLPELVYGRIVMANESGRGCIKELWENACMDLGPVYGPQSGNLINFVSPQEVKLVADINLLARNTVAKSPSWFEEQVCDLLMALAARIGWNGLLQLRSQLFVMEKEYSGEKQTDLNSKGSAPPELRRKRLCERWLDQLFLDLYEDLRISALSQEHRDVKYSGLEWELLGIILLRTWNLHDAVACLRTSIMARFDPISCARLLQVYMKQDPQQQSALDPDLVLELVTMQIAYRARFYDSFQVSSLLVLYRLSNYIDPDTIRNRVMALPLAERGIVAMVDSMLGWIKQMTKDSPNSA